MREVMIQCVCDIEMRGRYRQNGKMWILEQWQVTSNDIAGEWHKIHGNKRKDIGVLRLVADADYINRHAVK